MGGATVPAVVQIAGSFHVVPAGDIPPGARIHRITGETKPVSTEHHWPDAPADLFGPAPVVVYGMPEAFYHGEVDVLSSTNVRDILLAPNRYYHRRLHPLTPTENMRNGTIVHAVVLDGVPLDDLVAIGPDVNRRTKAGKEEWAAFVDGLGDREAVTQARYDTIAGAAAAVLADDTAAWLIENSRREVSIFWVEHHDGIEVRCKARIDILAELGDRLAVYDLKTNGRGVDRKTVRYAISDSGLPIQLAWYKRAATLAFDRDVASAGIISTFMGEPFDAVCDPLMDVDEVDADDGCSHSGEALFSRAMELCEKAIGKVARPPAHGGCAPVDEHGRPMPRRLRIHPRTLDKYDN